MSNAGSAAVPATPIADKPATEPKPEATAVVDPKPATETVVAPTPAPPKINTSGFIENDSPIEDEWKVFPTNYLIWDLEHAAPFGACRGTLRRIDEPVINGNTQPFLVIKPTRPCAAVMITKDGPALVRATGDSLVAIPWPHPVTQNLRALLTTTHWIEIEVRLGDAGNLVVIFNPNKIGKGG